MKEFLILKKTGANAPKSVNCSVTLNYDKNSVTVNGEIYCGALDYNEYKVVITNGIVCENLASGTLKFQRELGLEYSNGGYIVLFDNSDNAVLYTAYKNANFPLQNALDIINLARRAYNDDEIATVNYYEGENYETERIYNQLDGRDSQDKEEIVKKEENDGALLYENVFAKSPPRSFYDGVREKLKEVISSHKKDQELSAIIPNGEFCKICYDNDRYYSVGTVLEGDSVKYLCYAVRGNYGQTPPELERFCKFIPLSPFSPLSSGYYVIFQDAQTGSIIEN